MSTVIRLFFTCFLTIMTTSLALAEIKLNKNEPIVKEEAFELRSSGLHQFLKAKVDGFQKLTSVSRPLKSYLPGVWGEYRKIYFNIMDQDQISYEVACELFVAPEMGIMTISQCLTSPEIQFLDTITGSLSDYTRMNRAWAN